MCVQRPKASALSTDPDELGRLRTSVHRFVKSFGLLATDRTPCGTPIPLSCAYALLYLLEARRRGEAPSQQRLGRALCVDKSNVARLCAKMERDELVEQRRDEHDGRARCLSLTTKGKRLADRVEASSRARFARLLAAIPANERRTLLPALDALASAADSLNSEVPS
jgi:DNA-binding MarR family transcriptional regulator